MSNGELQLFGWTLVLFEDGMECPPLHICEHKPGLLGHISPLASAVVLFLTLTCCGDFSKETYREREGICERGQKTEKRESQLILGF